MRFKTRFDRWLVVGVVAAGIASCVVVPALDFSTPGSRPVPVVLVCLPWAIWAVVLLSMLPQYYEIREDGLFLRQGWRKILIPYGSLAEVQSVSDAHSAGVFSTQRIVLVTTEGKRFVIAVAEEERFLDELLKRCPQMVRKASGIGLPLFPSSVG